MSDPILSALMGTPFIEEKPTKRKKKLQPQPESNQAWTLQEKKTAEEIRKLQIANETALENLISKDMVRGIVGQIAQEINTQFVDLPRREATTIAALLGIPEKARELERLWGNKNSVAIENMKATIEKLQKSGVYE